MGAVCHWRPWADAEIHMGGTGEISAVTGGSRLSAGSGMATSGYGSIDIMLGSGAQLRADDYEDDGAPPQPVTCITACLPHRFSALNLAL